MPKSSQPMTSRYREIPSVDEMLRTAGGRQLSTASGPAKAAEIVRDVIESVRHGHLSDGATRESITESIEERLREELEKLRLVRQQRVINATGVIIHTNLGRAPLSKIAIDAAVDAAGYSNIEFDLSSGKRGRRGLRAERIAAEVTGAEDAVIVNNCAAAAFLVLSVFGRGGEVIVSRGELVEIGGDFRIPDVLERSGAVMREVGTTNRTKLADYERAINENTRLILRVHPSNYRITGFTASPTLSDLSELAHEKDLMLFEDAGSGALVDLSLYGLDEPVIGDSIAAGVDLVSFSGDKLMGGSQAGLIVGKTELIAKLRKDPLYRALRPDKITYAIIETTMAAYAKEIAFEEIPVLMYLSMPVEEIESRTSSFVDRIRGRLDSGVSLNVISGSSTVGGGAAPGVEIPTRSIAIDHATLSADEIAQHFRSHEPPIVGRVAEDRFLIDLRTVEVEDEKSIEAALAALA